MAKDMRQQRKPRQARQSQQSPGEVLTLSELWWRWVFVVELVASGAHTRPPLPAEQYRRLHGDLLHALRGQAGQAEAAHRVFLLELVTWVKPWLTQETLLRTEQEILHDLLHRCTRAGEQLGGRPRRPLPWKWIVASVLGVTVLTVAGLSDVCRAFILSVARDTSGKVSELAGSPYWVGGAIVVAAFAYAFWPFRKN